MSDVPMGSTWKRTGRLGTYKVDGRSSSQARMRNVKTRRAEWVGLSRLREHWTRIDVPTAHPAQQSALEMASQALKLLTIPPNLGKVDAVLLSLVSEVRAEEREACARHMEERASEIEKGGGLTAEWMARVFRDEADAIRARKG